MGGVKPFFKPWLFFSTAEARTSNSSSPAIARKFYPPTARSIMAGRIFLVLTGACQFGHGVGGFTTNFIHSEMTRNSQSWLLLVPERRGQRQETQRYAKPRRKGSLREWRSLRFDMTRWVSLRPPLYRVFGRAPVVGAQRATRRARRRRASRCAPCDRAERTTRHGSRGRNGKGRKGRGGGSGMCRSAQRSATRRRRSTNPESPDLGI